MSTQFLTTTNVFWLIAGLSAGVAITIALGSLWRRAPQTSSSRAWLVGGAAAVLVCALLIYKSVGRPDVIANTAATSSPHAEGSVPGNSSDAPQSMEDATAKLAERLASNGGSDADWQLLAQSYDFLGQPKEAEQARKHVIANSISKTAPKKTSIASKETIALLGTANSQRIQRRYAEARASYEKLIALDGMTADAWADYADVLASQGDKPQLSGAAETPIQRALQLNPDHPKALWLSASLAYEEHRYSDALATWRHLRRIIGDNESDAKLIDANIAEAELLAATNPRNSKAAQPTRSPSQTAGAVIAGTIDIDPKLAAKVTAGSTLFVYAKNIDAGGPPLAVFRTNVGKWPMQFKLDDSMAMLPSRNLSSAESVVVEARISKSGQATAASGDLQASAVRINVRESKDIRLRINKEVT